MITLLNTNSYTLGKSPQGLIPGISNPIRICREQAFPVQTKTIFDLVTWDASNAGSHHLDLLNKIGADFENRIVSALKRYEEKIADAREEAEDLGLPPATTEAEFAGERILRDVLNQLVVFPHIQVVPTARLNGGVCVIIRNASQKAFCEIQISPDGQDRTALISGKDGLVRSRKIFETGDSLNKLLSQIKGHAVEAV